MAENLKVTRYNDGTAIPLITDANAWVNLKTAGYCWYQNDSSFAITYGALYNWYAVNTGKLAPFGWHVPSNAEWTTLVNYLGGTAVAGDKLKEKGSEHWGSNSGGTNVSGFTALASGYRFYEDGSFSNLNWTGLWWTSTEYRIDCGDMPFAWYRGMSSINSIEGGFASLVIASLSIRCIKD